MAITATTLSAAIDAGQTTLPVTSSTGATVGYPCKIDNEYSTIVAVPSTTSVLVRTRGQEGGIAVLHAALANVEFASAAGDFPASPVGSMVPVPPDQRELVSYGVSGAIAIPISDTNIYISKASAAVMTLAAPATTQDGLTLTITSNTAAAHTITGVALIADGVSGSPHSTATFGAFKGASITLMANTGLWNVVSALGVTTA
jgi:hypothetical protein